jgi:hypothetical protein
MPLPVGIAFDDPIVGPALELFARTPNWYELPKILELVAADLGGENELRRKGWVNSAELASLQRTANSYHAVGLDARHARLDREAPTTPMTLDDAEDVVRRVLIAWLGTKA